MAMSAGIGGIMDGKAADRGDPNAGAYAEGHVVHDQGLFEAAQDFSGEGLSVGQIRVFAVDDKFVPAEAGHKALGSAEGVQALRNLAQNLVANRVAERIVDGFEFVEIEKQDRGG
jgi:hypothetical protein